LDAPGAQGGDDAAVDEQIGAGHEAGVGAEQVGGGDGDLVGGLDRPAADLAIICWSWWYQRLV
jgi:hypothetical protein